MALTQNEHALTSTAWTEIVSGVSTGFLIEVSNLSPVHVAFGPVAPAVNASGFICLKAGNQYNSVDLGSVQGKLWARAGSTGGSKIFVTTDDAVTRSQTAPVGGNTADNVTVALAPTGYTQTAGHVEGHLTGLSNELTLGAFLESIIPDNARLKAALQALETWIEKNLAANSDIWVQNFDRPRIFEGNGGGAANFVNGDLVLQPRGSLAGGNSVRIGVNSGAADMGEVARFTQAEVTIRDIAFNGNGQINTTGGTSMRIVPGSGFLFFGVGGNNLQLALFLVNAGEPTFRVVVDGNLALGGVGLGGDGNGRGTIKWYGNNTTELQIHDPDNNVMVYLQAAGNLRFARGSNTNPVANTDPAIYRGLAGGAGSYSDGDLVLAPGGVAAAVRSLDRFRAVVGNEDLEGFRVVNETNGGGVSLQGSNGGSGVLRHTGLTTGNMQYKNAQNETVMMHEGGEKRLIVGSETTGTRARLFVESDEDGEDLLHIKNTNLAFGDIGFVQTLDAFGDNNRRFLYFRSGIGNPVSSYDVKVQIYASGDARTDTTWSGGGAGLAEFFEWKSGNKEEKDFAGVCVALDGDKIRPARHKGEVVGVVSATPTVCGNAPLNWPKRYELDDFKRIKKDENGDPVINPAFDPEQEYMQRSDRPEWEMVEFWGRLHVRKDQPIPGHWIWLREVSGKVDEYLIGVPLPPGMGATKKPANKVARVLRSSWKSISNTMRRAGGWMRSIFNN